jgi:phage tail sheath protein FI
VLWGDRTISSATAWKFKHQRETMNYYINVLREGFDASVFAINDRVEWAKIRTALIGFFFTQYARRALDNTLPFSDACIIKIDTENNTGATQAAGDLNVEVTVAIVNTVERLKFSIGKTGVQVVGA